MTNASGGFGDLSNVGDLTAQNMANNLTPAENPDQHPEDAEDQTSKPLQADRPDDELLACDPVCGAIVNKTTTPYFSMPEGPNSHVAYFDSDQCKHRYDADPATYAANV